MLLPSAMKLWRLCSYRRLSVQRGDGVGGVVVPGSRGVGLLLGVPGSKGGCLVPGGICSWGMPGSGVGAWSWGCQVLGEYLVQGGWYPSMHWGIPLPPPRRDGYCADGTHATGIHSCLDESVWWPGSLQKDYHLEFEKYNLKINSEIKSLLKLDPKSDETKMKEVIEKLSYDEDIVRDQVEHLVKKHRRDLDLKVYNSVFPVISKFLVHGLNPYEFESIYLDSKLNLKCSSTF